jgi:hypothetical protein
MHVPKLLDPPVRRPHVEALETSLPERGSRNRIFKQATLTAVRPFLRRQQAQAARCLDTCLTVG